MIFLNCWNFQALEWCGELISCHVPGRKILDPDFARLNSVSDKEEVDVDVASSLGARALPVLL